ncbi:MAG TPA: histidinol phosphate phosphatase domain-containing protein [Thermoplasmata archaeon]|nr:histidinol phosphate phosphatase domain-containing protein [Thermoplasmata archaeon]
MAPLAEPEPAPRRRIDFHSHSYLTDGSTSATEMWTEAEALEHAALALTDHIALEDPRPMLEHLRQEARAWEGERFVPVVGVELTKVPPRRIAEAARAARTAGAEIVIVHGETIAEVVPPGTNHAAIASGQVDVLAHPGLLDPKDAELARANSVALEISARRGHSLCNGRVARLALEAGAELVVDSDAHATSELVTLDRASRIARGAGVPEAQLDDVLVSTPRRLFDRLRRG